MKVARVPHMWRIVVSSLLSLIIIEGVLLSIPSIATWHIQQEREQLLSAMYEQFPVTVDPVRKIIAERPEVNDFLDDAHSPFQAATFNVYNAFWSVFNWLASSLTDASWYQGLASVARADTRIVIITPGMRKEQVASAFAKALKWTHIEKKQFMIATSSTASLPLVEGSFLPGSYIVDSKTTPIEAQELVNEQFTNKILEHYSPETAKVVPLDQALAIASLIEREASGPSDMRLISGIIWNRLFINMRLQIDATLQYAKANELAVTSWWPKLSVPDDLYRKSPYNTYLNAGLPPTPIANPSVASVLAALNPKETSCLFYFHDDAEQFHCTDTYEEHVALLKQYFGRGK